MISNVQISAICDIRFTLPSIWLAIAKWMLIFLTKSLTNLLCQGWYFQKKNSDLLYQVATILPLLAQTSYCRVISRLSSKMNVSISSFTSLMLASIQNTGYHTLRNLPQLLYLNQTRSHMILLNPLDLLFFSTQQVNLSRKLSEKDFNLIWHRITSSILVNLEVSNSNQ